MSRPPDAASGLERAILANAARNGLRAEVVEASATRWASVTFVGARHRLTIAIEGDGGDWLAGLAEADLPLRRHLVADVSVEETHRRDGRTIATIEALTVEDA